MSCDLGWDNSLRGPLGNWEPETLLPGPLPAAEEEVLHSSGGIWVADDSVQINYFYITTFQSENTVPYRMKKILKSFFPTIFPRWQLSVLFGFIPMLICKIAVSHLIQLQAREYDLTFLTSFNKSITNSLSCWLSLLCKLLNYNNYVEHREMWPN